ncbi:MAG: acyl-homoserine-lactone synthase [Candidatus Moraniibacteriota bacterium]
MKNNLGVVRSITPAAAPLPYEPTIIFAGTKNKRQKELVKDHYRRRHDVFAVQYGWEDIRADGMEQDGYDRFGHCDYVLLVRADGRVGAGCRLIWSTPASPLPIQEFLEDPSSVPTGSVEISRMTATPETARSSSRFLGYLLGYLAEREVSGFYVTIRKRLLEKYAHSGFNRYELLPGQAMEKTSRDGTRESFLPVRIGLEGEQQAISLLSRLCR